MSAGDQPAASIVESLDQHTHGAVLRPDAADGVYVNYLRRTKSGSPKRTASDANAAAVSKRSGAPRTCSARTRTSCRLPSDSRPPGTSDTDSAHRASTSQTAVPSAGLVATTDAHSRFGSVRRGAEETALDGGRPCTAA